MVEILALAALLAAGPSAGAIPAPRVRPVEWLHGDPVSAAELEIRAVLIEFWATW